ncbi:hypothetical protein L226DRAFT_535630 [Lentinus tigrinus ALCF2SS1-7]|uniref:Uncharacterized protein n=1 Tax=Lentinus tigrinus ALCF2SS1-6 TaxID=1328759 RepID=A0A5C2RUD8_9APHY|nr:hypothetical protein L227DRAFT_580135 [Lentinus tigrinus ALCF2SS1-6]RPD74160.1 hypothetical protein L226DRAFT_535630 [Lentinus tigrinus ALCF2SS1-7]
MVTYPLYYDRFKARLAGSTLSRNNCHLSVSPGRHSASSSALHLSRALLITSTALSVFATVPVLATSRALQCPSTEDNRSVRAAASYGSAFPATWSAQETTIPSLTDNDSNDYIPRSSSWHRMAPLYAHPALPTWHLGCSLSPLVLVISH